MHHTHTHAKNTVEDSTPSLVFASLQVPELEKSTVRMKDPEQVKKIISAFRNGGVDRLQVCIPCRALFFPPPLKGVLFAFMRRFQGEGVVGWQIHLPARLFFNKVYA